MLDERDSSAALFGLELLAETVFDIVVQSEPVRDGARTVDFRILFVNQAGVEAFRPQSVVGRLLSELLPKFSDVPLFEEFRRVMDTGEPYERHGIGYGELAMQGSADGAFDVRVSRLGDTQISVWRNRTQHRRTVRELHGRHERTALLAELAGMNLAEEDPTIILEYAAKRLAELFGDGCLLVVPPPGQDHLQVQTFHARDPEILAAGKPLLTGKLLPLTLDDLPDVPDPEGIADVEEVLRCLPADVRKFARMVGLRHMVRLPLLATDRKLGALVLLQTGVGGGYTEAELEFCVEVAGRAALLMENARLGQEQSRAEVRLKGHADRLAVLAEFSKAPLLDDPVKLLDGITSRLTEVIADGCITVLADDSGTTLPLLLHSRQPAMAHSLGEVSVGLPPDWDWFAVTTSTGPIVLSRREIHDLSPLMPPALQSFAAQTDLAAVVKMPLTAGDRFLGVLTVFRAGDRDDFGADDVAFLAEVAARVSLVLDNANLRVAREQAMVRLAASEERFRVSFDNAPNGIAVVSVEPNDFGRILETNDAFADLVGYPLEQAGRLAFHAFVHPDDVGAGPRPEILEGTVTRWAEDLRFIRRSGETIWVRSNASLLPDRFDGRRAAIIQVEDITARKGAEVQLAHRAMHDSLTDLPNRHLLMDRLSVALESAQRSSKTVALLYIDLDRFKEINDSLGHEGGDLVLKEVSRRLSEAVRAPDTAARLAGDEFVVVCPEIKDQAHAEGIAGRLLDALDRPVTIGHQQVSPAASIGIALTQGDRTSPDEMLRWADLALYRAKATGRHRFTTYSPVADYQMPTWSQGEGYLRDGLTNGWLQLHYQPVVDLHTGVPVAVEALLRIHHPDRGVLLPADFIGTIDDADLAVEVTRWVLAEGGRQVQAWRAAVPDLELCVNVGPRLITDNLLAPLAAEAFVATGLEPGAWWFEVAGPVLDTADTVPGVLAGLRGLGARVTIDDYGGPGPSLVRLSDLPVDAIKIDRRLVQSLTIHRHSEEIVGTIVALAHALNARSVAVGVETEAQESILKRLGCRLAQGHRFLPPLTATGFDRWLIPRMRVAGDSSPLVPLSPG